ncbi:XRE family transcriptional regulator [Methylobacterium sp. NMS14P]|uniref:helix-turn-helix transcriptional regulator n=1 Tax=Methylobacterium sp. NMS14P TaxID=2894310 RepID=UPI002358947E|nr:XRE family transcriptional regulator [Methylobacterium sp. NMS14P]WCS23742.1 XRE family transcriptional regulator [Methylobacterium sp. NMS14P]
MPPRRSEDPNAIAPVRIEVISRRGLSQVEAGRYVGVSMPTFDMLVSEGQIPQPFRVGRRVIWDLRKLDAAFDVLSGPEEGPGWEDWDDPKKRIIPL